jgi:transposase InsO family protein
VLTVIDNWSRECVLLEVGFRLKGQSVVDALNRVGKGRKLPATITVDHEFKTWSENLVINDRILVLNPSVFWGRSMAA